MSVLTYARGRETRQGFERILQHRIDAERSELPAPARVERGDIGAYGSGFAAEFSGTDSGTSRSFAGRMMMAEGLILITYLEGIGRMPAEFSSMRTAVLERVGIAPFERTKMLRGAIGSHVLILLATPPDPSGSAIRIQDYVREGKSFIPMFSSREAFRASTKGADLKHPLWEIDRRLLISLFKGGERVVLDPGLEGEVDTPADELRKAFPEPFEAKGKQPVK